MSNKEAMQRKEYRECVLLVEPEGNPDHPLIDFREHCEGKMAIMTMDYYGEVRFHSGTFDQMDEIAGHDGMKLPWQVHPLVSLDEIRTLFYVLQGLLASINEHHITDESGKGAVVDCAWRDIEAVTFILDHFTPSASDKFGQGAVTVSIYTSTGGIFNEEAHESRVLQAKSLIDAVRRNT